MELDPIKISRRLKKDGWFLSRHGARHDIYRHPVLRGIITLPRHRKVSMTVARSIASKANWR